MIDTATALPARYRTDLVTSLLAVWFTVGLMLDAWAHNNIPGLETFFTAWHAVFYTGFVAVGGWIAWTARAGFREGRWNPSAMPTGYPAALLALVGFAVAAVGDFLWHRAFGIEQSINILFSPTHLGLAAAMMVIITTPVRSAWANASLPAAPSLVRVLPAVLSLSLAATLVLLFFQYGNAFGWGPDSVAFNLSGAGGGDSASEFVAALAVTNLVLVVPLLVLARRFRLPIGAATTLYLLVAGLVAAITGFDHPALTAALVLSGIAVDLLSLAVRPSRDSATRYRLFGFLAPLVTWTLYLAAANALAGAKILYGGGSAHPESAIELWTGAPLVQALVGLLVAIVLVPAAAPTRSTVDQP